jgi:glycosyltransferase involved in cell wall biosynthesis
MRKLRVAIVAPSLRILGGQAVQADRLIRAWTGDPDVEAWLVPINPLPPRALRWAIQVKYLRTLVTETRYGSRLLRDLAAADVVHVFSASYMSFLLAPLPAIAAARLLGRPVLLNYHSGEAPDHLRRSAVARAALAHVDRNVVPSAFLVDVLARFGIPATAISNIVDLNRFPFRDRQTFGPRLVSTRNFEDMYNVGCTIRAFGIVQDRYPDASLTLAGGGSQEAALRALAAHLGLRNLTFAGRVPPDAIASVLAGHDIYVQSSNIDNMPMSILEAFASGLPVVSTNPGGVPYLVTHLTSGLLVPVNDHEALAAQVLRILDDAPLGRRLAKAALDACEGFRWESVRGRWLDVYRSMAARPRVRETSEPVLRPADGREL